MSPHRDTPPAEHRIWPDDRPPPTLRSRLLDLPPRLTELFRRLGDKVGPLTVDGVHYRPLHTGSLARRLSVGPGFADYAVTFPSGERMRIRVTRERVFADLLPDPARDPISWLLESLPPLIRPGDRAIILGAGTGMITHAVTELVGPSGAVTALDPDAISVAYARKRYPAEQTAHERGTDTNLRAEPDGSAETILLTPLAQAFPVEDIWRLVSRSGRLIAAGHHAPRLRALATEAEIRQLAPISAPPLSPPGEDRRLGVASRAPQA